MTAYKQTTTVHNAGTQFRKKDFKLYPLENKATTNDFRATIGLQKIDEQALSEAATSF